MSFDGGRKGDVEPGGGRRGGDGGEDGGGEVGVTRKERSKRVGVIRIGGIDMVRWNLQGEAEVPGIERCRD